MREEGKVEDLGKKVKERKSGQGRPRREKSEEGQLDQGQEEEVTYDFIKYFAVTVLYIYIGFML